LDHTVYQKVARKGPNYSHMDNMHKHLVELDRAFLRYANGQTNKTDIHTHHNTSHPSRSEAITLQLASGNISEKNKCPNLTKFWTWTHDAYDRGWASFGAVAACCVFPVLWIMSCFHIMVRHSEENMGYAQSGLLEGSTGGQFDVYDCLLLLHQTNK